MVKKIFLSALAASLAFVAPASGVEQRVDSVLSMMSLREKIGQLNQLNTRGDKQECLDIVAAGEVGSIINENHPDVVRRLQKTAVEKSRLGIPLIFGRDVIHGYHTIFPIPLGQAATWNPELVGRGARIAAVEATHDGIRWTFSPMVDVSRDARWGRIAESAGEDPLLNEVMGLALVRGYQGSALSSPTSMAACAKHFCGYGAAEGGRDYNTTWIPEPLLRDVYLKPFKALAKAGVATFMTSFNDINGTPSTGNPFLLRKVLRDEWGFDGVVVSDWDAITEMIAHRVCADKDQAAAMAVNAGTDIDMEGDAYLRCLPELVESGKVDIAVIDNAVRNVLRLKFRLGLFDNPYIGLDSEDKSYAPAHLEAARKMVGESAVLIKNDGILPLAPSVRRIAVVGPMADAAHDQCGTWCLDLEKSHSVTPLAALRERFGRDAVVYAPGLAYSRDRSTAGFKAAIEAARKADVVLFFAGEEAVLSGEAHCLADVVLQGRQSQLLEELALTGTPVVTVLMAGRPLAIRDEVGNSNAVIYSFHPGTMAGPGLVDVITGDVNPSGHLPVTLPLMAGQMPLYYAQKSTGRPAQEIVHIDDIELEAVQSSTGCTSYYLDAGKAPYLPFGYGLSYTTFGYGPVELSSTEIPADGKLIAACTVTNTGSRTGATVAQLYVSDCVASLTRPVKELKAFRKIELAPGESRRLEFELSVSDLGFHQADGSYIVEPGQMNLWIAPDSSTSAPAAAFTITGNRP